MLLFLWLTHAKSEGERLSHYKCCISFPAIGSLTVAGLFFQQLHGLLLCSLTPGAIFGLYLLTSEQQLKAR